MKLVLLALFFLIASATPVFAYSDPGSGLLILQILGSMLVGTMFYFKKIKDWILSKLGIRSNVQK
jgi:hypothetical protein